MTDTQTRPAFSAEMWAAFWAAPDVSRVERHPRRRHRRLLAGRFRNPFGDGTAYVGKIAELVTAAPDLALELVDSATVDGSTPGEQLVYLHYVGRGTGPDGPFAIRGLDRVRTRDGIVVENVIRYDQVEPASI